MAWPILALTSAKAAPEQRAKLAAASSVARRKEEVFEIMECLRLGGLK
jgi:hypothetical protein